MKARRQKRSWHSSGRILHYHESTRTKKRENTRQRKIGVNKSGDTCGGFSSGKGVKRGI